MAGVRSVCLVAVLLLAVLVRTGGSTSTVPPTTDPTTGATTGPTTGATTGPTTGATPDPTTGPTPSTAPSTESPETTTPIQTTTPSLPCPVIGKITKNNVPEDQQGHITSTQNAPGITAVAWASYNTTSDYIDASLYVSVTYNAATQQVDFVALPALAGVRDYPQQGYPSLAELGGTVQMTCGSNTGTFDFSMVVKDTNTATPTFDSASYNVEVYETYPAGLVISDLVISASDNDAETSNNEVSFTLQAGSPFSLTVPVKTNDLQPTYTTQLKLEQSLVNGNKDSYQLNVTAKDPGGLTSTATITVTVRDMDTEQPTFTDDIYTATVDDPTATGPLETVPPKIEAVDPDPPGNVIYTLLTDSSRGQFKDYFSLDSATGVLSLAKDITDKLEAYSTTVSFTIQATEDGGNKFTCRSMLVITLPAMMTTTTEPPTSTTPLTSTEASTSPFPSSTPTGPTTTDTTPDSTTSTPVTSSSTAMSTPMSSSTATTPDITTSTPVTSSSTEPTATTPDITTSTPVTSSTEPTATTPDITTSTPVTSSSTEPTATTPDITTSTPVTSSSTEPTATTPDITSTPVTSSTTTGAPTSTPGPTPTPTPTPAPVPCPLFLQRQYYANASESSTGDVITVEAVADDVTYFLRTPGYEDSFALDEFTGTLSKKNKLGYQQISLLVQAIPPGGSAKDQTTRTDLVDWDETLIIVDVTDENDSPPVLDCTAYSSDCSSVVVGYPASETATLPMPLLKLTVTDDDQGDFGVDGIQYQVDSSALDIDSSGMIYLVKQQTSSISASVTAKDNYGQDDSNSATAKIKLVPVRDEQVFFVRTDSQLTDVASVTSLLHSIAQSGGYMAVFSLDFQALSATGTERTVRRLSADQDSSTIYIYALRQNTDGSVAAVDASDIEKSLDDMGTVEYIETKHDQMSGGGGGGESSNTGLIVAVAVLACLLVAVIVGAVLRQRQLLRRPTGNYSSSRQKNDAESYTGGMVNSNYSPATSRRASVVPPGTATYSNRAFQPADEPASSGLGSGKSSVSRSAAYPQSSDTAAHSGRDDAPPPSPLPVDPAPLIAFDEPATAPTPKPEEPTPDYSLKSVGFKETVICVSPPIEPHEEEEEEEEDGGEDGGEDGEDQTPAHSPEQAAAGTDGNADGSNVADDENSML